MSRRSSSSPATRTPSRRTGFCGLQAPQEIAGHLPDRVAVRGGAVQAARPGDGAEVGEADLDADGPAAALLAAERGAQLAGETLQHRLELREPAQVAVESGLARLGFGHPAGLERALVLEAGQRPQVGPEPGSEPRGEVAARHGGEAGQRGDPTRFEPHHGLGPDAGHEAGGGVREPFAGLGRRELEEAVGLLGVRGHLGHQLARADADRAAEPGGGRDRGLDPARGRAVTLQAREVEVRLIESHDFDSLDLRGEHGHHLTRARAVELEVRGHEHRIGAQPPGALGRGGREDPEAARLVARRGDHGPRPPAGHHHRPAAELGAALELDAHVERVHVHVRYHHRPQA